MATAMRYSDMRRQLFSHRPTTAMKPARRFVVYVSPAENLNTRQILSSHDCLDSALKAILYEQDDDPVSNTVWGSDYSNHFYFRVKDESLGQWYEYYPRMKKLLAQPDSPV